MFLGEGWRGIYIFEVRRVIFPSRTVAAVVHVIPKAGGTTGIALLANLCLCHFFQSYVYPRDEDFFYLIFVGRSRCTLGGLVHLVLGA